MARRDDRIEHLLRRAGFGSSPAELDDYIRIGYSGTLELLLSPERSSQDVDVNIGAPGYVAVTTRGAPFQPNTVINDARQRWLFRMVHSQRPLVEKMTLFWHNHFATAYSKIAGVYGATVATQMMAAKPSEDSAGVRGQIELFREYALGTFLTLLTEVAKDPAMLVWLDGRTNVKGQPQENFARELMELFTFGVGLFTEQDVYAGAQVFTGWNLRRTGDGASVKYEFFYDAGQHDTNAKSFSFPIYSDGNRTIAARGADAGMQDGMDLLAAVVRHPETGRRLARKLWGFFVSEVTGPPDGWVNSIAGTFSRSLGNMRSVMAAVLGSQEFQASSSFFARYSSPVEFVARALKETGWTGFSVGDAVTPLANMGQQLFEPPDVNGWDQGRGWYSTGAMLARMNFASTLTTNQKVALRDAARPFGKTPDSLLSYMLDRLSAATYDNGPYGELLNYLRTGTTWTGSDADLLIKAPGLAHLVLGSSEYQLV